ncbi:MFS transporter [Exophiala viscosa]|uniref:MFS transporter n=1 Tax=Exophiala viscosa TaxID=2486360 RepID=A0AAN6E1L3_9EURO|nr:MFS transporter [Exophiala viscosa]
MMDFMLKKPEGVAGSTAPAISIGMFVSFGGVLFGYDTGTIGGILAMTYWRKLFSTGYINPTDHLPDVSASQSSEIVSILSAGTFLALSSLRLSPTTWAVAGTVATATPMFVAGRFFAGLGVGLLSATIPLYQSETAPKWIRGTIVGAYQWAITIGLLLAAVVLNSTKNRNDTGSYRIPVAVQFAWSIILVVGMLLLPETPRYLIKRGKPEEAARSLSRLRRLDVNHPSIVEELAEVQANHNYELSIGGDSYMTCFRRPTRKRLLTGIGLQALQQLTGVNFIFYYGTSYFLNSGISNPFIISMTTSAVNVASTVPGLYLVEKWGRRPLLMFGAVGMSISQMLVAAMGTAKPHEQQANQALVAFVCIYIFFFACSWGPCAWVVTSEIFPLKARAKGLSMTTASNWLLNWAIAYATPYMVNPGAGNANLGSKVFFVWGGFCCVCVAFVYFCIYETKGLSLEQVDELYDKVGYAWQSTGFVPTVHFNEIQETISEGVESNKVSLMDLEQTTMRRKSHAVHNETLPEGKAT